MRRSVSLAESAGIDDWRSIARALLQEQVRPENVNWGSSADDDLFGESSVSEVSPAQPAARLRVPRDFIDTATTALMHADPDRFALLYRMLWRITHDEPHLLETELDADVVKVAAMNKAVRRDMHKMKAFVRFRLVKGLAEVDEPEPDPTYISWFEPEHHILAATAPFFVRRFTNMRFAIITPELSAYWDRTTLSFGPGGSKAQCPPDDGNEDLWRVYYASIFNPARLKISAMTNEMPKKYWRNLPEAPLIGPLSSAAAQRTTSMIDSPATKAPTRRPLVKIPSPERTLPVGTSGHSLPELRDQAAQCRACDLWQEATQTVFGEGPGRASIMLVGEQPGDQEDLAGHPFVGPAGKLLNAALEEAGVSRESLYVTNAVKHFKFVVRGKRRLHQSPNVREIEVCSQWLFKEIDAVQPTLIVAMGASAAQAIFQRATPIKANRGKLIPLNGSNVLVTVHPSYLLRLQDPEVQRHERSLFVEDLKLLASHLKSSSED